MFVILTLIFTTVLAHSHEKYIDLLPEEEKQQFLDKVARRIMETVESGEDANGNKFSGELTDEQLKGHSKFVQEILKQESAMLRKRRAGTDLKVDNLEVMASTTDKNDDSVKHDTSSDNNNTNSTVNRVKRHSTEEEPPENSSDFIKVHIVTETSLPMQKRSERSDGESDKKEELSSKKSTEEEFSTNKSKDPETSTIDLNVQTKEPEAKEFTTDSQGLSTETEKNIDTTTSNAPESHYKILRATGSSHEDLDINDNTDINENMTQTPVNDTPTVNVSVKTHENSENNSTNSSMVEKILTNYKSSPDVSDKTSPKSIFIDLNDFSPPPAKTIELNAATTVDHYQFVTENSLSKHKLRAITATTTVVPALTPKSKQKSTNNKQKRVKVVKRSENTTVISYIASEALKKVKSDYNLKKKSKKLPSYRIHEISLPKFGNPPFLRSPEPMEDSPLFVPVYKYSPNNAYYNPTNRLGPNAVEENSIELDTHNLRGGEKNVAKRPVPEEFILQLDNAKQLLAKVRKFGIYQKKNREHFEDDLPVVTTAKYEKEHSDENSAELRFPDSHEKLHPMNSMKRGTKTHIKAIRDVLFKNKIYGERGPAKKDDLIRDLYGNNEILHKYDKDYKTDTESGKLSHSIEADNDSGKHAHSIEKTEKLRDYWKKKYGKKKPKLRNLQTDDDIDIDYYIGRMDNLKHKINDYIKGLYSIREENNNKKQKNGNLIQKYVKNKNRSNKKEKYLELSTVLNKVFSNKLPKTKDLEVKHKIHQKNNVTKVSIYMKALKNLIKQDSKGLKQYDWLSTTVEIQDALAKLFQIIRNIRETKPIHPADVQLLKYTAFLHNFAIELKGAEDLKANLKNKLNHLPKNKKKIAEVILKEKNLLNKVWMKLKPLLPNLTSKNVIDDLNDFLLDVEKALEDLHEAIKNISQITTFKRQNWWANLKDLYLTTNEKHLREVLLHLSFIRLLELMVKGAEKGMEKDFVGYMKTHRRESKKTFEEMMFVIRILDEIKNSSN